MIQRIAVFGATGRTGECLVAEALAQGLAVRALCRPNRAMATAADMAVVHGELTDPGAVGDTLCDAQAVCCVFGPRPPYTDVFCAEATRAIINAAAKSGAMRLICQTGAMIGPYRANRTWPFDLMARWFARRQPSGALDRWQQELSVRESGLEWTVVKPPRLTDGVATGQVRAGLNLRVGLSSKIGRADLARFLVEELRSPRFTRQVVFVAA